MLSQAANFLLQTIEFVFIYPALLRFYLQLMRVPSRNPISNFVIAITDFAVRPLRKFVPGLNGVDVASLLWAWLMEIVLLLLFAAVMGANLLMGGPIVFSAIAFLAFVKLIEFSLNLLFFAILAQALLSWINPYNPVQPVFVALTRPFLRPVQRILPTLGGVDLSPMVVMVLCQLMLMIPVRMLENTAMRMISFAG